MERMDEGLTYSTQKGRDIDADELGLNLEKRSSVPIFVQIQNGIKYHIATGTLMPFDRLPSVRKLAKTLEINPNTVDKAYMTLETEGFITIEKGRGTFVSSFEKHVNTDEHNRQIDILVRDFLNGAYQLGLSSSEILDEIAKRLPEK